MNQGAELSSVPPVLQDHSHIVLGHLAATRQGCLKGHQIFESQPKFDSKIVSKLHCKGPNQSRTEHFGVLRKKSALWSLNFKLLLQEAK